VFILEIVNGVLILGFKINFRKDRENYCENVICSNNIFKRERLSCNSPRVFVFAVSNASKSVFLYVDA
jgi:hypothetical protein